MVIVMAVYVPSYVEVYPAPPVGEFLLIIGLVCVAVFVISLVIVLWQTYRPTHQMTEKHKKAKQQ